jgi:hypothetical protein
MDPDMDVEEWQHLDDDCSRHLFLFAPRFAIAIFVCCAPTPTTTSALPAVWHDDGDDGDDDGDGDGDGDGDDSNDGDDDGDGD